MSSNGQIAGAIVGGVAGFFLTGGNPLGALQGASLGAGVGAALDPPKGPTVQGPRLNDLAVQTSTYGAFIPRVYGTVGIHGNLLWLENNQLKETVRKKKQGGKGGGGGTTVKTYSYSATFALGLCQGPIAGVRRIWCMDRLIYNAGSDDLETIIASNQNAAGWRLYLGTDDQMPDTRYEADVGVGNASAFRGIAYLVFYDFQLAEYSNTLQVAQFKVEVVSAGETVNVLIDADPATTTNFSYSSTGYALGDMYGLAMIDNVKAIFANGVSSFTKRRYRLGRLEPESSSIVVPDVNNLEFIQGIRSYDGNTWFQYKSNDTFADEAYLKSDIGQWIGLQGFRRAQGMIHISTISDVQLNYVFCYASNPGLPNVLDRLGVAATFKNQAAKSNLIRSLAQSTDWNVSTDGDEPYQWMVLNNTLRVRVYDESLSPIVHSFIVNLPNGQWPNKINGNTYGSGGSVCCHLRNRVAYIVTRDGNNGYRYAGCDASGVIFNYTISSASTAGQSPVAVWPYNADQAILQTTDRIIQWRRYNEGSAQVSSIIEAECAMSGLLTPGDIDTTLISASARGYRVNGGTIRSSIEPLQAAFPFDVIQSGYHIKFVPRGQSPVANVQWEDLGAADGVSPGNILTQSREMDTQLPAKTTIKYLDALREYATGEQYAERINTEAINRVDRELPIVLTSDEAAGVAEVLQLLPWMERTDATLSLPPSYLHLEPSDVITVQTADAAYQLRLADVKYATGGRLQCAAKPSNATLYTPNATGGDGVTPDGTVELAGETEYLLLDIPVVDETLQDSAGISLAMTGTTSGWPGGVLFRSSDDGQTWTDLQAIPGKCTFGVCGAAMPARSGTMIDRGSSLVVNLFSGELESITEAQMLVGANYAAYGVNGRWEIIRFQNATLNANGTYTLNTFVRGDKGTEHYTGAHQLGDMLVLLDDPDNAFVGFPTSLIGVPMSYRGITVGVSIDTDSNQPYTYNGVNLECLSPVDARGLRDVSGNFTGTFNRRSRLSSSWWTNGIEAPIGETTQSYEIDVMNGSAVVRTIATSTPTFSYSAASQVTDFGSTQASITFRIFQLSSVVGRGYQLQVTL